MTICHFDAVLNPLPDGDYACAECGRHLRLLSAYDFRDLLKWVADINTHLEKMQAYLEGGNLVLAFQEVAWAKEDLDWPDSFDEIVTKYLDLREVDDEKRNERAEDSKVQDV